MARSDDLPKWLEKLPSEWGSDWLKWSVRLCKQSPTEEQREQLPYISNEEIASWTGKLLKDELQPADSSGRLFHMDDVLFNKLRPYLAKVFHADFSGISSGELLCLRSSKAVLPRFLFYVISSKGFIDAVNAETFGTKMPRADWEIVGHQALPLSQFKTQRHIARFLDKKTARIDTLIEKKRALLKRLVEKRQALITHAVTKGLDPDAPMKDSGIDWLGQIPAHWEVRRVKQIAKLESGHTPDKKVDAYWENCQIPWISLNDTSSLRENDYISYTAFKINELGLANSSARLLPANAVVFTRDATIGESAITTRPMAVSQHIIAWLCDAEIVTPEFLLFAIYGMTGELLRLTNGSTIGTIGLGDVKSLCVALPPREDQQAVVEHVSCRKKHIASVYNKLLESIGHLREYRSALITAAVTGQLDVPKSADTDSSAEVAEATLGTEVS